MVNRQCTPASPALGDQPADGDGVRPAVRIEGHTPTAADRKNIAIHLYKEKGWTQQRIAEALGASQSTIRDYLSLVETTKPPLRPKGGRPKSRKRLKSPKTISPEVQKIVAKTVFDEGQGIRQAAEQAGVSQWQVQAAVAKEDGQREAIAAGEAVDLEAFLSKSAKERLQIAFRWHKDQRPAKSHLSRRNGLPES